MAKSGIRWINAQVLKELDTDIHNGLTEDAAKRRREIGIMN